MTRIIAGALGGRRLHTPPGTGTRPTADRVRESLFSRLDALGMLTDARVLDLCAGSGALGLEALSRGARDAVFVEKAARAAQTIKRNIGDLGLTERCRLCVRLAHAAAGELAAAGERFDVVFADPPYPMGEEELGELLAVVEPLLRDAASLAVVERSARSPQPSLPPRLRVYAHTEHGETALWLLEREDSE